MWGDPRSTRSQNPAGNPCGNARPWDQLDSPTGRRPICQPKVYPSAGDAVLHSARGIATVRVFERASDQGGDVAVLLLSASINFRPQMVHYALDTKRLNANPSRMSMLRTDSL